MTSGWSTSTTSANTFLHFPTTMRIVPTAIDSGGAMQIQQFSNNTFAASAIALGTTESSTSGALVSCTHAAATANIGCFLRANNDTAAYLGFSAEL